MYCTQHYRWHQASCHSRCHQQWCFRFCAPKRNSTNRTGESSSWWVSLIPFSQLLLSRLSLRVRQGPRCGRLVMIALVQHRDFFYRYVGEQGRPLRRANFSVFWSFRTKSVLFFLVGSNRITALYCLSCILLRLHHQTWHERNPLWAKDRAIPSRHPEFVGLGFSDFSCLFW